MQIRHARRQRALFVARDLDEGGTPLAGIDGRIVVRGRSRGIGLEVSQFFEVRTVVSGILDYGGRKDTAVWVILVAA